MSLRDLSLSLVLSPFIGLRLAGSLRERGPGAYKVDLWHAFPARSRPLEDARRV